MTFDEAVGLSIRTTRKVRGVSMPELAGALGVTVSALSRIERGVTRTTIVHLRRVARKLSVPGSEILKEAESLLERSLRP